MREGGPTVVAPTTPWIGRRERVSSTVHGVRHEVGSLYVRASVCTFNTEYILYMYWYVGLDRK